MRFATILLLAATLVVAQTIQPRDAQGWIETGSQAYRSGRYLEATEDFRKAIQLDPSNVKAHSYLGTAYMTTYIPGAVSPENAAAAEQARTEFQRVLQLSPNDETALAALASLSYQEAQGLTVRDEKLRKLDESRGWNQKLIAIDPQAKEAYYTIAVIDWLKWYPAYMDARARLGMRPETPGPLPDLNTRQQLNNDFGPVLEESITNLNKALEIDPQYDDAMAYLNLVIRQRADLRDSASEYKQDIDAANAWVEKALDTKRMKAQKGMNTVSTAPPPPPPPPPQEKAETPQRIRVGSVLGEAKLVHKVNAVYPPQAKQARIQGTVRFRAVIGKDGSIKDLQVISGHPLLIPAAQEAVKQWVYKPTLLNGEPVEIITQIDVPFTLSQ